MISTAKSDRIYWSCRRGMLELDLTLIPFYQHQYAHLNAELQQDFRNLLECTDMELYSWLIGHTEPEQVDFQVIIKLIRDYAVDPSRPRAL